MEILTRRVPVASRATPAPAPSTRVRVALACSPDVGRHLRGPFVAWALLAGLVVGVAGCSAGGSARDRAGPAATTTVAPPAAPAQGLGGGGRHHAKVRTTRVGGSPGSVTVFEPEQPAPRHAPVVVFTQGRRSRRVPGLDRPPGRARQHR